MRLIEGCVHLSALDDTQKQVHSNECAVQQQLHHVERRASSDMEKMQLSKHLVSCGRAGIAFEHNQYSNTTYSKGQ